MDTPKLLVTITELARRSGVSSRTIRFWSDEGLIPVARRSAARYRLYDAQAVARLDLVRTLRELGLGLPAITSILKQQHTLAQAASTHVAALDARIAALRLQRAVLRAVIRRGANAQETQLMQKLVHTSAAERKRIVDDFVTRAFEGIPESAPGAHIANAMRSLPPELPDEPSDAQVEAWLELVGLVSDESFQARVRQMATTAAAAQPSQPFDMTPIRQHAAAALAAGVAPDSQAAREVLARMLPPQTSAAERSELAERLALFNDVRVERYWQLMGILNERPAFPPMAAACAWFIEALRAAR